MAIIDYRELDRFLTGRQQNNHILFSPVYLLYGEEMIYKEALQKLLDVLIPEAARKYNYEPLAGTGENVIEAIRQVNTYTLLQGSKVVALLDSDLFKSSQAEAGLIGEPKAHPSPSRDMADLLVKAIEEGFPEGHSLLITTDSIDKRRRLFKAIEEKGVVVDCSVSRGERKADKDAQDRVLRDYMAAMLSRSDKTMAASAYTALCEMTGFDLRAFTNNLNKLIDFVGDRKNIAVEDVSFVLERTKKDPIYAFTDALTGRKVADSLYYLNSLLADNFHPLQILAAMINQIRRMIVFKQFCASTDPVTWQADMSYPAFQKKILPLIKRHDSALREQLADWERSLTDKDRKTSEKGKRKRQKKEKIGTDLLMAPNPKSSYPVYKMLQKSGHFTREDLLNALILLHNADELLKSSRHPAPSVLKDVILKICIGEGEVT